MDYKNIYILGIGGSGMSSIGKYLKQKGVNVIGYDQRKSYITNLLKQDGIDVVFSEFDIPYDKNNLYIYSSAIPIDSEKFSKFHDKENVISRPEFLQNLSNENKIIGITGTHGKTSTTALLSHIFHFNNVNVSYIYGGVTNFNGIGGLIVDIGVRGFLPASLIDVRRVKELSSYVGEEVEAKILELDKQRNNIVLSRKAHLEEELSEERQGFLGDLQVGDIKDGKISSIVNFGAFVDIGGMDGLVHVSELSWRHVENPNEIVKVGDSVTIKVLEIDNDKERISLSIKQVTEDPWLDFELKFNEGDVVDGEVTKVVPFGAFVTIGKGVEGLVHVSEISVDKIDSPELALAIGQSVKIKILELDIPKRRVNLSIKQADPNWEANEEEKNKPKTHSTQSEDKPAERQTVEGVDESLENILQELKERGIGSN